MSEEISAQIVKPSKQSPQFSPTESRMGVQLHCFNSNRKLIIRPKRLTRIRTEDVQKGVYISQKGLECHVPRRAPKVFA